MTPDLPVAIAIGCNVYQSWVECFQSQTAAHLKMVSSGPSVLSELAIHNTEELLNALIYSYILPTLHNVII